MSSSNLLAQSAKTYRIVAVSNASEPLLAYSNQREMKPELDLILPNAFTPNGDGLNDTFGFDRNDILELDLKIYNRWGELVFHADQANKRWDGTFAGKKAPTGVYAYQLKVKAEEGISMLKDGSVLLLN